MKKILLMLGIVGSILFLLTGCDKFDSKAAINKLKSDSKKTEDYVISAEMDIVSNEETYTYDVTVHYKQGPYYKVVLVNKTSSHEQVILKNKDGVYV